MASFGESLRQERLQRQITLEQVAAATKISQRFLQAIEGERLQDLPGGIFNRNFIRTYARYLGLDDEHYVGEYVRSTGDAARTSDLPIVEAPAREPLLSGTALLAVLIAGVVGLGIWAGIHLYLEQQQAKRVEARVTQPAAFPVTQSPARQLIAPPRESQRVESAQAAPPQNQSTQPAIKGAQPPIPQAAATTTAASTAPAVTPKTAPAGERALIVAATVQPAWVSVYTDGHWRLEATLQAGERKEIFFHTTVRVTSGNAGATAVSIDGKPMGTLGKIGMVAHFNWPPASANVDGAAGAGHAAPAAGLRSVSSAQTGAARAQSAVQH